MLYRDIVKCKIKHVYILIKSADCYQRNIPETIFILM